VGRKWTEEQRLEASSRMKEKWANAKSTRSVSEMVREEESAEEGTSQLSDEEFARAVLSAPESNSEGDKPVFVSTEVSDEVKGESSNIPQPPELALIRRFLYKATPQLGSGLYARGYCVLCEDQRVQNRRYQSKECPCHEAWEIVSSWDEENGQEERQRAYRKNPV